MARMHRLHGTLGLLIVGALALERAHGLGVARRVMARRIRQTPRQEPRRP
jgi:hypothetical protein